MNLQVLALGVLSGVRPATAQAAVIALLRTRRPRSALLAFILAGLAWTMALGVVIVTVFHGVGDQLGRGDFAAVVDLVAGVAALGFAAGIQRGMLDERIENRRATAGESRITRRLSDPSLAEAGLGGVVTHLPGLIYLVALNAIAADEHGAARAALQVGVYNLLWFALPLIALALAVSNPAMVGDSLERATAWARSHRDRLLVAMFGLVGLYLVVKGAKGLP